jgi:hypothetical protein
MPNVASADEGAAMERMEWQGALRGVPVWFWFAAGAAFGGLVPVILAVPELAYAAGVAGLALAAIVVPWARRRRRLAELYSEFTAHRARFGGARVLDPCVEERVTVLDRVASA